LGIATCAQGSPEKGVGTKFLAGLGMLAVVLAVGAIVSGSLTVLSLLVIDIVLLWALSTSRHVFARRHKSECGAEAGLHAAYGRGADVVRTRRRARR
jgi:hypothetical protein